MTVLGVGAGHAKRNGAEEDKDTGDCGVEGHVNGELHILAQASGGPIDAEAHAENGKVEGRIVVVDVRHTGHGNEWQIVQEPADDGVDASVVDVIHVLLGEFFVAALPADCVPDEHKTEDAERGGATPVDDRVAEQEVLYDTVIPATHAETDVQERPLPRLGGEVVLLVRVGDQCVVRCHHGDVEVDKVTQEGGLVCTGVTLGNWSILVSEGKFVRKIMYLRLSLTCDSTFQ